MNIVIATGIYPPELGGPAEYAKNLGDIWRKDHTVSVEVFSRLNWLPTGLRHIVYFFSILPSVASADFILALDTLSCALPAVVAARLCGKKIILRTGGDFLWEKYVERTGDLVLLKDFYKVSFHALSVWERITFSLVRFVLQHVDAIIWSTEWQKNIFLEPYRLSAQRHYVVENYYGERLAPLPPSGKNFLAASRMLRWKNIPLLKKVMSDTSVQAAGGVLDLTPVPHAEFLEKIRRSYAVIITSLGDISPNTILDAIRCGKPFIVTRETGLYDRIRDIALFVDPKSEADIREKVLWLLDSAHYEEQCRKIASFSFVHTWQQIASEYMEIYEAIARSY